MVTIYEFYRHFSVGFEKSFKDYMKKSKEKGLEKSFKANGPLKRDPLKRANYNDDDWEPAFPLEEPNPVVEEGDLREIYRSKTDIIPVWMPRNNFSVHKSTQPRIIWDDLEFIEGLHRQFRTGFGLDRKKERIKDQFPFAGVEIFGEDNDNPKFKILEFKDIELKSPFKGKYLIVDVGHAHLVGVAYKLMQNGVDCSYVVRHNIFERFKEALKYWAGRYKEVKEGLDNVVGYATMIDIHRDLDIDNRVVEFIDFPSPDKLRGLGVEEIVYLTENRVGETFPITGGEDIKRILNQYKETDFPVKCLGIDYRKNRREEI